MNELEKMKEDLNTFEAYEKKCRREFFDDWYLDEKEAFKLDKIVEKIELVRELIKLAENENKYDDSSLDGLKVVIHSATWTEHIVDFINTPNLTAYELLKEIYRINNKDFKNEASARHAKNQYECKGSLVSLSKGSGGFELTGYTNFESGEVIKFTLYMTVPGTVEVKIIEWIEDPKGMQQMGGAPGMAATFVMKYSGFGKLSRALMNHMEGKDPWTGEEGSTSGLLIGGVTDLLTMGTSAPAATTNIILNGFQEGLSRLDPSTLEQLGLSNEQIGVGRETLDIILSIKEKNGIIKATEIISNIIQGGYAIDDLNEAN